MTSRLSVAVALRLEAAALRRGLGPGVVVRTGMGPSAASGALRGILAGQPNAVCVAGLGGATTGRAAVGDLLVATAVHSERGGVAATGYDVLAAALRSAGYTVHCGPLWTSTHVVRQAERRSLADRGMLAVDMESFPIAAAVGVPFAALRVIVDTPNRKLARPGVVLDGVRALHALSGVGPALKSWSARMSTGSDHSVADGEASDRNTR
ncbi:MAG: hypothetical protein ACRDQ1_04905 [Sciscionella sp.]